MRALQPLHLRRIYFIQLTPKKDKKLSQYLQRLRDQGEVADIDKMTPQALVLHLFLFHTSESPKTKYIRENVVQFLHEHDENIQDKHLNEVMSSIKGRESDLILRESTEKSRHKSQSFRTEESGPRCKICNRSSHETKDFKSWTQKP